MSRTAITLPALLGSRESARELILQSARPGTNSVELDASANEVTGQGAADELVKGMIEAGVVSVHLVGASTHTRKRLAASVASRSSVEHPLVLSAAKDVR